MKEWKYLESKPFRERYIFVAQHLKDCKNILEVGGYKTPITNFLKGKHNSVTVIDPLTKPYSSDKLNGEKCKVRHLAIKIQDYKLRDDEDCFVFLGMYLNDESFWPSFANIMKKCKTIILEVPQGCAGCLKLLDYILKTRLFEVELKKDFDFSNSDLGDLTSSYPPKTKRNLYILKPRKIPIKSINQDSKLLKYIKLNKIYLKRELRKTKIRNIADINRHIGKIGILIKKISPKVYYQLKKLKHK